MGGVRIATLWGVFHPLLTRRFPTDSPAITHARGVALRTPDDRTLPGRGWALA